MNIIPPNKSFEVQLRISNNRDCETLLVIEPWGEVYKMPSMSAHLVVITGDQQQLIDVEWIDEYTITIYGWPTGTVQVFDNGKQISPSR